MNERTGLVTMKGKGLTLLGNAVGIGQKAPDFEVVANDLSAVRFSSFSGKICIISSVPSLDTPVCQAMTCRLSREVLNFGDDALVLTISMDLPFAASRFCKAEHLENVITLSAFRSSFSEDYGVKIAKGPLEGLCARAVLVLGKDNKILHSQLVSEITEEPDYEAALTSLKSS